MERREDRRGPAARRRRLETRGGALILLAALAGCADARPDALEDRVAALDTHVAALEQRVAALEQAIAAGETAPTAAEQVRGLELRIQALEAGIPGAPASTDAPGITHDAVTGRISPTLVPTEVEQCVFDALESIHSAELSHDAAFDSWEANFRDLGWAPSVKRGCDQYYAARISLTDGDFLAEAVITRGPDRGRSFRVQGDGKVVEGGKRTERDVLAFVSGAGWAGSAR